MTTTGRADQYPLVAVCTPVYNGEKYLVETMESVQAQTYPNVVHVLVDNASTDKTPEIIERYRNRRVPLHVARNEATVPMHENFNRAFAMMPNNARYFRLLCADDLIFPEATARAVEIMERDSSVGLVAAAEPDERFKGWPPGEIFDGRVMLAEFFRSKLPTSFAHCVYRRVFFDQRAPEFYDSKLNNNDVDAAMATMLQCKIGYLHEPQVFTRVHEETVTSREMGRDKIHFAEWLVLLARYGSQVLGENEAAELRQRFKRYYCRRILRWRFVDRNAALVRRHMERLDLAHARPTVLDYADAVIDWPLKQLGLRPHWTLYPQ